MNSPSRKLFSHFNLLGVTRQASTSTPCEFLKSGLTARSSAITFDTCAESTTVTALSLHLFPVIHKRTFNSGCHLVPVARDEGWISRMLI